MQYGVLLPADPHGHVDQAIGKVFRIGKQPMNINTQVFYNVETPTDGAKWQWRFQVQMLFPK